MRHLPKLVISVCLGLGCLLSGCDVDQITSRPNRSSAPPTTASPTVSTPAATPGGGTIRIATFNIQVLGTTKASKPHVMEILADVIRQFDVVAIQELRTTDATVLQRLIDNVNVHGHRYDYLAGPRLGRTSSKEQYVYVWNTATVELYEGSVYTVDDPQDLLHREPLVARFQARAGERTRAFSFQLVNIHTDPDETDTEVDALADVFLAVQRDGSGEDDVVLLGDLNVDERHLGRLGALPDMVWTVHGEPTNTRLTKSYDNLLFDRRATVEFAGKSGVLDLMEMYHLDEAAALEVSDHMPVWAEFSIYESQPPMRWAENN